MKQLLNKIRWFLVGMLLTLQLAGCVSTEQFYEDVSLSRESAYRQWKDRKKLEKQSQIKIAGKLDESLELGIATRKDEPLLNSIMQKAIDTVTEEEKQRIYNHWFSVTVEQEIDYSLIWKILLAAGLLSYTKAGS